MDKSKHFIIMFITADVSKPHLIGVLLTKFIIDINSYSA